MQFRLDVYGNVTVDTGDESIFNLLPKASLSIHIRLSPPRNQPAPVEKPQNPTTLSRKGHGGQLGLVILLCSASEESDFLVSPSHISPSFYSSYKLHPPYHHRDSSP